MTTGTILLTIMSGLSTPMEAIPMLDLAVPYEAPKPLPKLDMYYSAENLLANPRAKATPRLPKKEAEPAARVVVAAMF